MWSSLTSQINGIHVQGIKLFHVRNSFFTDSTIVLAWIGSHSSRWKTLVANRVGKIQNLSSPTQWHHISGDINPADLATRGLSSASLLTSSWFCGPQFLHQPVDSFSPGVSTDPISEPFPEQR
ncbi:unnamed protein product [Larinioides sclopetarius]|uniref:Uncharacterized protein n=1 Tax=Larinioides sclopetarius TaxID=280406 RepID=A0AAV2AP57_9ARAC